MTGNIMTWYSIGRHAVVGRVPWLHKTQTFSRKFIYFGLVPKSLRRLSIVPVFRQLLIPSSTQLTCIVQVKYVHEGAESESDSELEDSPEEAIDLYNESETLSFRQLLYCNSEHPLIKQLNASTTVQEVFNFVKEHENELGGQLVSQVVVVLWDLQKSFSKVNVLDLCQNQVISSLLNSYNIPNYINEVCGHQDFEMLLQLVDRWNGDMSVDALTATLLYLNKMGVSVYHPVMQKLISRCESAVECYGPRFPLSALSRFAMAVHSRRGLWPIFIAKTMLPRILTGIESCNSVADFRYLSICLINICQLVNCTLLNVYKSKVDDLVGNGIITAQDSKAITKAVKFLNFPQWSHQNDLTIRKLLLVLKGNICGVSPTDLITIHKVLQNMMEPADIVDEMHEAASQLLSQVENEGVSSSPVAFKCITDLLSCLVFFSSPTRKLALEKLVQQHIEEYSSALSFPALFRILQQLNTSNVELCDAFWTRTLDIMQSMPTEREYYKLFRVSHRYMYFNNNLNGRYRHYELERQMIQWLWHEVENGTIGILPSKFAQVTSFILAYGNIGERTSVISESALTQMVCKVLDMKLQFSKLDCMYISRGLQIGKILASQRRSISSRFLDVFTKLDTAMNSCAQQHLKEEVLSLPDITIMMKTYISRSNAWETQLFENLIKRHEKLSGVTSSKLLRDISASMLVTNCLIPSMSDQLVNYVVENGDHILGDTAVKLLYMCYSLGYTPAQAESFFSVASNVILRDKERMQVLALLQAAIALCFFHRLPEELVHFIFTLDFLKRLDEEMLHCYAKESYCVRVRHAMMHLNRAVCIDYPETDVPWFHEKYCQQVAALRSPKVSPFRDDVHQSLISVMGTQKLVQVNMHSPYFYGVDFQVLLNRKKMPVSIKHQADSDITRIAILLWIKDAFTNGVSQLCGEQQLKQRHLEMMGYKVIGISSSVWNSMYMAEKNAKTDYLRQRIWPSTADCNSEHYYKRS